MGLFKTLPHEDLEHLDSVYFGWLGKKNKDEKVQQKKDG